MLRDAGDMHGHSDHLSTMACGGHLAMSGKWCYRLLADRGQQHCWATYRTWDSVCNSDQQHAGQGMEGAGKSHLIRAAAGSSGIPGPEGQVTQEGLGPRGRLPEARDRQIGTPPHTQSLGTECCVTLCSVWQSLKSRGHLQTSGACGAETKTQG